MRQILLCVPSFKDQRSGELKPTIPGLVGLHLVQYHISFVIRQRFFFSIQKNLKNLDPSYKMDLELWDCLGRVKLPL